MANEMERPDRVKNRLIITNITAACDSVSESINEAEASALREVLEMESGIRSEDREGYPLCYGRGRRPLTVAVLLS